MDHCIRKKKCDFEKGLALDLHLATKELQIEILKAEQSHRRGLESKTAANNLESAWD